MVVVELLLVVVCQIFSLGVASNPGLPSSFFFHSRGRPGFKATLGVYVGICMAYV